MEIILIILFLLIVITGYIVSIYNNYIKLRNSVTESDARIHSLLRKRYQLLPNLINTVSRYMSHEHDLLKEITELRERRGSLTNVEQLNKIENTTKSFMFTAENYPDLKADSLFINLQNKVSDIETENDSARRLYNHSIYSLNTFIQIFPNNIFTKLFDFQKKEMLSATKEEQKDISFEDSLK